MRSNQLSYETVSFSKIFFIYNVVSISLFLKLVNLFIEKIFPFSNFLLFYTCVEQLLRLFYASIFIFKQGKSGKEL